jgi:hypothetical protein
MNIPPPSPTSNTSPLTWNLAPDPTAQPPNVVVPPSNSTVVPPVTATPVRGAATTGGSSNVITSAMSAVIKARNVAIQARQQQFDVVSKAITAPPTTTAMTRVNESGTVDQFLVPILPDAATTTDKRIWALYLASGLKSRNEYQSRSMTVQVLALFFVLYPNLVERTRGLEWHPYELTMTHITMLRDFHANGQNLPPISSGPNATKTALDIIRNGITIPHTLGISAVTLKFFLTDLDWLMFHGYAGLLLFTMHKVTTVTSNAALMTARPGALCRKYNRTDGTFALWHESGRPSLSAYTACTTIWKLIPATRYNLMFEFAHSSIGQLSAEREALFTTVRLMQWTDLSHVPIIDEALANFDLLRACPLIAGDIAAYQAGIIQLVDMMPVQRDAQRNVVLDSAGAPTRDLTTMPYVKALWGDRKTIAQRNTMPVLLNVAIRLLQPTRTSLRTYTGVAGYADKVQDVLDWYDFARDATRDM